MDQLVLWSRNLRLGAGDTLSSLLASTWPLAEKLMGPGFLGGHFSASFAEAGHANELWGLLQRRVRILAQISHPTRQERRCLCCRNVVSGDRARRLRFAPGRLSREAGQGCAGILMGSGGTRLNKRT